MERKSYSQVPVPVLGLTKLTLPPLSGPRFRADAGPCPTKGPRRHQGPLDRVSDTSLQTPRRPVELSQSTEEAEEREKEQVSRGPERQWLVGGSTRASGGTACLWAGPARGCKLTTVF